MTTPSISSAARSSGLTSRIRSRHPADLMVAVLLVVTFLIGPLKLLGASWFSYAIADGLAFLVIFAVFTERAAKRKPLFVASPLTLPLLLLAAFCVLQLGNPEAPFIRSVMGLRSWLLYLAFYFVGFYTLRSVKQLERVYALLLTLGFLTAAYGIYQWQVGPQSFASWSDDYGRYARIMWSAQTFRAFSTFVLPNTFGSNMGLLMLLALSVAAGSSVRTQWRLAAAAGFACMGAGIAASGSRGPVVQLFLGAALGLVFMPGLWHRVRTGLTVVGIGGAALLIIVLLVGPVIGNRFLSILDPGEFFWKWFVPLTIGLRIAQGHPFGMGMGYTAGVPQFIGSESFLPSMSIAVMVLPLLS